MILINKLKRIRYASSLLFLGIIWLFFSCSQKPTLEGLKENIIKELFQAEGNFALAFKDLNTGKTLFINEKEVFHAASTMKTPVMIEVFKQVAAGKISLDDSVTIVNEFKSIVDSTLYSLTPESDSEQDLYTKMGTKKRLGDLVYDMIIISSNLATNIIIELVDAKKVTQSMRDLGATDIMVLRGVEDQKAYEAGL
ncbi:MAG TPA: serine hydrolase, partial [Cyclobacteriaceae bacterium]